MSATGSPSPAPAGLDEIPAPRLACAFSVASAKPPALPCWYPPPAGGGRRGNQKLAGMRLAPWARHSSDPAGVPSRSAPKVTEIFCFEEERRRNWRSKSNQSVSREYWSRENKRISLIHQR